MAKQTEAHEANLSGASSTLFGEQIYPFTDQEHESFTLWCREHFLSRVSGVNSLAWRQEAIARAAIIEHWSSAPTQATLDWYLEMTRRMMRVKSLSEDIAKKVEEDPTVILDAFEKLHGMKEPSNNGDSEGNE